MKRKFAFSIFILALAAALVGGATIAFFTDENTPNPVFFTAGTVEIAGGEVQILEPNQTNLVQGGDFSIDCFPGNPCPPPFPPPQCPEDKKIVYWCVENTGTKRAYIRVKPPDGDFIEETAVGAGEKFSAQPWWHQYLTYEWTRLLPIVTELIAGQNKHAGWVTVSRDFYNFYVTYQTENGWSLMETHVYAATKNPVELKNNEKAPGRYPYKNENHNRATEYTYIIPLNEVYGLWPLQDAYFVTHAVVVKGTGWSLNNESKTFWTKGEDGWYYYNNPVSPGDRVCIYFDVDSLDPDKDYKFKAEAVQASNNAINMVWQNNPFK